MGLPSASLNMQKQIDLTMENKDKLALHHDICVILDETHHVNQADKLVELFSGKFLTQRKELRDRIEKLRCTEPERIEAGMDIYNKALDSVLNLLQDTNNKK